MKTKFLLAAIFAFSVVMGIVGSAEAAGFAYSINTEATIASDLKTRLETRIDATAGTGASVPGSITLPRYGVDITELRAVDNDGAELTVEQSEIGIVLRLSTFQAGPADDWSVRVTYNATTGLGLGQSSLILLTPFDYGELNVSDEQITIVSASDLGAFVTRGDTPSETSTIGGNFITTWQNNKGPLLRPVGLLFGDAAVADITLTKTLENTSFWWQTQSFVLPPDTNQQQVFIRELTPKPSSVRLDIDGNVIVEYKLRPRQKIEVSAKTETVVNSYTYALNSELLRNDIDPILVERYTELNEAWVDTVVAIDGADTVPVKDLVELIYDEITREFASPDGESPYERSLVRSNALVGELRANGIPSRVAIGAVFGNGERTFPSPQPHTWVEAYLPDVGWMTLDPSFEQRGKYFGVADVQRVALALRGLDPDYPPDSLSDYSVVFNTKEPPATPVVKPTITATKHMILPGLSVDVVNVTMPDGVIVDNAGIAVGSDEARILGSLAPFQEVHIRSASFLAAAFTSESVQYGIFGESGQLSDSDILAQATTSVSYLPMITLLLSGGLILILIKVVIPRRRASSKRSAKKNKESKRSSGLQVGHDVNGDDIENVDMLAALDVPDEEDASDEANPELERKVPQHRPAELDPASARQPAPSLAATTTSPPEPNKQSRPEPLRVEKAHDSTPEEIRRELHKKRKNLIQ